MLNAPELPMLNVILIISCIHGGFLLSLLECCYHVVYSAGARDVILIAQSLL